MAPPPLSAAAPAVSLRADPPPAVAIIPPGGWPGWGLAEAWRLRSTCLVLARRSLRVRYRQTLVGAIWAVLQPLLMMVVFTTFLSVIAGVRSDGTPYPVFIYAGLLLWGSVAKTVAEGTASLIAESGLIRQVWFPRVYCPVAAMLGSLVDLAIGALVLVVFVLLYGIPITGTVLLAPLFLALALAAALGIALWTSALNAAWRDVGHLLPFLLQVWLFTSPIVYPASLIPAELRLVYALNPLVAAVGGFRWAIFGGTPPEIAEILVGSVVALAVLVSGYAFFRLREPSFVDVV